MILFIMRQYQNVISGSRIFSVSGGKTRGKMEVEAGGRPIFAVMSPECINSAQYISIHIYKDKEGKNLRFPGEIFGLF